MERTPRKSILVAEDEKLLRESLVELLQQEGYEVAQAAHGKEAYELALNRPFDLVLTDLRMPEMDGMELLRHLRQLAPQTPVVILTAFGTVESAVAAMREGASDYLLKPVQFDDVLVRVQRAIELGELIGIDSTDADKELAPFVIRIERYQGVV